MSTPCSKNRVSKASCRSAETAVSLALPAPNVESTKIGLHKRDSCCLLCFLTSQDVYLHELTRSCTAPVRLHSIACTRVSLPQIMSR